MGSKGLVSDLEVYYEILAYFDMQVGGIGDQGVFVQVEGEHTEVIVTGYEECSRALHKGLWYLYPLDRESFVWFSVYLSGLRVIGCEGP